ncbi:hypothetical protein [Bradyrhizobium sp. 150]|uniref:hypothetical protein n=1 Tax=Bradyrhizobium sp. 150 TaxID=2782625 RepID=UPI001FF8CD12|nr:hypothetical protein [Bradyrhizobium sp. 150]MCK1671069.1 hypothetical protein [Bradyrhizobium sp. 150]
MEFLRPYLDAHAVSINRFDPLDRVHTVGASDVGQCERKVYWTKNLGDPDYGAEPDADYVDSYGAKLRGTMFENVFWAPGLKASFGGRLLFAGEDQKTFVSGYLSATPDGMLTQLTDTERYAIADMQAGGGYEAVGTEVMVECKTYDPRTNLADPKTENVFQTHVQMGLVRELTEYKPTHSILSYTDASWWNEGKEFVIEFDPSIYANAKKRAERIMTATSAEQLQPEGWIGGGRDCEYCPFTRPCGVERRRVPDAAALAALPADLVDEVIKLARAIKQMDSAIDTETAVMRELQDRLKTVLRNASVRKVPGVVSWSSVKGKSGWDNKSIREAAIEAGVDISVYATEGEPSDRLQITLKG